MGAVDIYASRRGELIGRNYVLDHVLGVGGMGVVYSARQRSLDRTVALKLPRAELAGDPEVRERLRVEALASSRIDHLNSVRVLDFGDHRGDPYLVMEHVAGPRLGQLVLEHGPFAMDVAVDLVRQITAALGEAHHCNVVHADVKCDNVLVETLRDGTLRPRLIDWGIARFIDDASPAPNSFVTGTPDYLAPEVALGDVPTFAADVYAVGVMLYELIAGITPFAGSPQVMLTKVEDLAIPLALRYPELDVPRELDAVIMRSLSRNPSDRFADASALGRALDAIVDDGALMHRPAQSSATSIFSTEATTATMAIIPNPQPPHDTPRTRSRASVLSALEQGDIDATIVAYLELARALVDDHQLDKAITELENAVDLLGAPGARFKGRGPVWRILLTLAALYDARGEKERAHAAVRLAREGAAREGSAAGCERAEQLRARLTRSSTPRRPR